MSKKYIISFLICVSALFAQVNMESQRNEMIKYGKNQKIDFNWNLSDGNTNYSIGNVNYRYDNKNENIHRFLIVSLTQGNARGDLIKDKGFLHLRHVINLTPIRAIEFYGQLEYNKFIDLNLRELAGSGFRITHIKNNLWKIYTGHSLMVETEHYDNNHTTNIFRISEYISLTYSGASSSVSLVTYVQPNIGDFNDVRMLTNLAWNIPLSHQLSLKLSLVSRFDNDPEYADLKKLDYETRTGLSYLF